MSRRIARAIVLIATVATLFFYPLLAPPVHRIDLDHLRLIKSGMTEADVEAILGVPAGDYDWATLELAAPLFALSNATNREYGTARLHLNDGRGSFVCGVPFFDDDWGAPDPRRCCDVRLWTSRNGQFCVVSEHGRVVATYLEGPTRVEPPWIRWWRMLACK